VKPIPCVQCGRVITPAEWASYACHLDDDRATWRCGCNGEPAAVYVVLEPMTWGEDDQP